MKNFVIIGSAGYIAERHIKAIKETGNNLIGACDRFDVMGRIDSYFPNCKFFIDLEEMDKWMDDTRRNGTNIDYVTICTPNYMHASHIRFALRNGINAICEKPLVINYQDISIIDDIIKETGKNVYTILQLRHHPVIIKLKEEIDKTDKDDYNINIRYITSRGDWYFKSWKSNIEKSGGLVMNIGIHFFDMLIWIFGEPIYFHVNSHSKKNISGFLKLKKARVNWFLSVDENDLPPLSNSKTFRSITVDDKEIEFSEGFVNLHTVSYQNILNNNGFGINDTKESIILTSKIRDSIGSL